MSSDHLEIRGLELDTHIGVPAAERAQPQRVLVDLCLHLPRDFSELGDALEATVDYAAVAQAVVALAAERPRQLIETLAADIASAVLREAAVRRVEVTVRKFILPNTEFVAAHCVRERNR